MPNYWMEDYESGVIDIDPFEDQIVERCKQIIKAKKLVRIGYVILDEMKIEYSKHGLLRILACLEETGRYESRYVKHKNGRDDFIVTRKAKRPLVERYWLVAEILKYSIAAIIGGIITKLFHI